MAGTDNMLLALSGIGHFDGKAFGFASCDRVVGAAEGINVLRHRKVSSVDDQGEVWERGWWCSSWVGEVLEGCGGSGGRDGDARVVVVCVSST